jgi:hypothetical protein
VYGVNGDGADGVNGDGADGVNGDGADGENGDGADGENGAKNQRGGTEIQETRSKRFGQARKVSEIFVCRA